MTAKEKWKWAYKVVRSILFTTVGFIAFLYAVLYVLLSIPAVQNKIRGIAEKELSSLFTSELTIENIDIYPFNEVVAEGVTLYEPYAGSLPKKDCAKIERLGAGISLWNLLIDREIVITYVELLGLDAKIRQDEKGSKLNIDFLIEAFKPKDKNKPPAKFDLKIKNIVIRKSKASFERPWIKEGDNNFFNRPMLSVSGFNADITIPRLSNDEMIFDVRRIEMMIDHAVKIERLSGQTAFTKGDLSIRNLILDFPESKMTFSDILIPLSHKGGMGDWLEKNSFSLKVHSEKLKPSEFAFLWSPLSNLSRPISLDMDFSAGSGSVIVDRLRIETLSIPQNTNGYFSLDLKGEADFEDKDKTVSIEGINLENLKIISTPGFNNSLVEMLRTAQGSDRKASEIIAAIGNVELDAKGGYSAGMESRTKGCTVDVGLKSGIGELNFAGLWRRDGVADKFEVELNSEGIDLGKLLAESNLGRTVVNLSAEAELSKDIWSGIKNLSPRKISDLVRHADIALDMPEIQYKGYSLEGTRLDLHKSGKDLTLAAECDDENFNFTFSGDAILSGSNSELNLTGRVIKLYPGAISFRGHDFIASGDLDMHLQGDNIDNLQGEIGLNEIHFEDLNKRKEITLDNLEIIAAVSTEGYRSYSVVSDWIEGGISGNFRPSEMSLMIHNIIAEALPTLVSPPAKAPELDSEDSFNFDFTIFRGGDWPEYLGLPIQLLYEATVKGEYDGTSSNMNFSVSAPFVQQGKDKLIRNTRLNATLGDGNCNLNFGTVYPTKKGDLELGGNISSVNGDFLITLDFNPDHATSFYGSLDMSASVHNALPPLKGKEYALHILPSKLYLNHAEWDVSEADIKYYMTDEGPKAEIDGFSISHDSQFVKIDGTASTFEDDSILAVLNDVDLDYIFDTLNINYVKFGGIASGEAEGKALFSKNIMAQTRGLHVKDLSYNQAVLGDAELHGNFDIVRKRIGIRADIAEDKRSVAVVDGGIWLGRDSLSFGINADKVRIGFLAPFMSAFASKVEGRASGDALLYGTFSDIDMKGRLFADTIALGVGYTNVTYCGSDSVFINPGRIVIPSFTLRDEFGNRAILAGELTHRYFHDPEFDFRISDADNLLLYDTNAKMNPVWYGHIFGSGSGRILGRGNYVDISADMTVQPNSTFTFVLSDIEEAAEYKFLTFTDKRKEKQMAEEVVEISEEEAIIEAFKKKVNEQVGPESVFGMDIRATLTPSALLTLVMDPVAGDKITARGSGAMNLTYRSDTDEFKMLGKYVLEEGVYNFSLQDVVLKDFIIKQGSSISFNGDPMAGLLDIRAAYRVNANLAELDQSFALDRDLNRTQVPVDAMLLVTGEMEHPDIKFDIELPTLHDEVEQKVRSVISSDDMMNLQMIYLLALNRFYTPEYMGGTSGGEWASVASSTISSQLSNILGQLTDKVSVAPSFRSDKGDFSDLEVDVALSSRLFNNRLLINGNLGYRDPSTSSTTFIGDFDVEYLLNRKGNWRLKAYNHFNDQNYYLKSALTTQGVGIVWRRDFNHIFGIKRREKQTESKDSLISE